MFEVLFLSKEYSVPENTDARSNDPPEKSIVAPIVGNGPISGVEIFVSGEVNIGSPANTLVRSLLSYEPPVSIDDEGLNSSGD